MEERTVPGQALQVERGEQLLTRVLRDEGVDPAARTAAHDAGQALGGDVAERGGEVGDDQEVIGLLELARLGVVLADGVVFGESLVLGLLLIFEPFFLIGSFFFSFWIYIKLAPRIKKWLLKGNKYPKIQLSLTNS